MSVESSGTEINQKIIQILDKVIEDGDWEATLFLRTIGKQLKELREKGIELLENAPSDEKTSQAIFAKALQEGQLKIYISLFQSDGSDLNKWEGLLKGIGDYSVSRHIYGSEEQIQAMVRSKSDPRREAYAVVSVAAGELIKAYSGRKITDRSGFELLTLKDSAVKPENIIEFVHNAKRYHFHQGKLVLQGSET